MKDDTTILPFPQPNSVSDPLTEIAREGARRKLALWRYDYNTVRPHSSLGNQTPQQARRALEQFEGSAPGVLAPDAEPEIPNPTCRLSF